MPPSTSGLTFCVTNRLLRQLCRQFKLYSSHTLEDSDNKTLLDCLDVRFHDLRVIGGTVTHQAPWHYRPISIKLKKILAHGSMDTSVYCLRCKVAKCTIRPSKWRDKTCCAIDIKTMKLSLFLHSYTFTRYSSEM